MILAIDASTTGCSVAVFLEGKVVVSLESKKDRSAAESLTLMIEKVLDLSACKREDLKAVAVAKGPGSYTGLRIAVSTAKGLAFALGIPLLSYGTLDALCYAIPYVDAVDFLCPMIDARRMEVFCGFYDAKTKALVQDISAELVDENSFSDILSKGKVLFFGEGSAKCKGAILHENSVFLEEVIYPEARTACKMVSEKMEKGEFEDLTSFEPFYLKEYMFKK
ncbi:tRNA (adenosine(37)-N6)-threonylcarbamoyltransferase complex dimerization subunit type 1 TsaB [Leadbetterella byssophila]|uniref:tRNA (adenosine(37)-N6)-threonylcarbamoyltransferase complex dimerization subunit type 1 TsaB n=1 Tax=Leadbetterella byssophila TaxID=316068 RepID=UPI0039A3EA1A